MNRLKDLREDRDLRQVDVANATGINQQTLSNYETEKTRIDSDALIKLADFYNVSIDYILCRTVSKFNDAEIEKYMKKLEVELENIRMFLKTIE